jgi:CRP-like cAMP-binding protein
MSDGDGPLSVLRQNELDTLEQLLESCAFEAGQALFVQGAAADGVHLIRRGKVGIFVRLPGGESAEIAQLGRGEILGELMLGGSPRSATALALEQVETGFVRRDEFIALYESFHPASFALLHWLARSLALRVTSTSAALSPGPRLEQALEALGPVSLRQGASFDPRPFLPKLPFFQGFLERDIADVVALGTLHQARRGWVLFREGDPGDAAYIVLRGAVEVLSGSGDTLCRIALRGPGTVVGEMAVLLQAPRNATCRVREDATLLRLSHEAIGALLDSKRKVSFKFLRAVVANLTASVERTNRTLAGRELARRSELPPAPQRES